jgi:hypothetical protein
MPKDKGIKQRRSSAASIDCSPPCSIGHHYTINQHPLCRNCIRLLASVPNTTGARFNHYAPLSNATCSQLCTYQFVQMKTDSAVSSASFVGNGQLIV